MLLDAAQGLVQRHIPGTTPQEAERAVILGVKRNIELGWTQIQDAGGSYAEVEIFKKLYGEGKIKLRIYKAVVGPGRERNATAWRWSNHRRLSITVSPSARSSLCPTGRLVREARRCSNLIPTNRTRPGS